MWILCKLMICLGKRTLIKGLALQINRLLMWVFIWLQGATHVPHACYICWLCIGSFKTCHKSWNLVHINNHSLPCYFIPRKRNNYVEFNENKVTWQGVCFGINVNQSWVSMWFSNEIWILFNIIIVNACISYREERKGNCSH
jgi:hypothetical protein